MKKHINTKIFNMRKTATFLCLLFAVCLAIPFASLAQEMPDVPQLTKDPAVRYGTLSNGLTYYIRHNEKPKGQADFYIAQKVGSMQEEDNQQGLAHFLEHMCFNGTKSFPGNKLIEWLETVGVKFGYNLNAYTSFDETVYNISNVPVARESVQDSCLLVLHDWANELTLDPQEIDKERGVIHQEWVRSNVGEMRVMTKLLPKLFNNSKYGYRLPIGTMDVVDNFPYQDLRDYYEKWYRPDLQGIIVVGDIDVDRIEGKIKEMFSDIPKAKKPAKREYVTVPDHKGTVYAYDKDPEIKTNIVELIWLTDPMPFELRNTQIKYVQDYLEEIIAMMLNNRFQDMMSSPDAPFAAAYCQIGEYQGFCYGKDAFNVTGISKDGDIQPVLEAIYREVLRAAKNGFTETEFNRAKEEYLSRLETAYNNRESRENEEFVAEYKANFLKNDAMPGIDMDYMIMQQFVPALPLDVINQTMAQLITPDNRVVFALLSDKPDTVIPTDESLAAVLAKVDGENIEAFVDNVKTEPLVPALPAPGKIVKETVNTQWDATEWQLSNGVKVLVKPTKFKEDEILMTAYALGGTAEVLGKEYDNDIIFGEYAFSNNGLGTYTNNDLSKYLKGKQVGMNIQFDNYDRAISGSSTPKDLPTLMELIYMGFTGLNYDENEFKALQAQLAGVLKNQESTPNYQFGKMVQDKVFKSKRLGLISTEAVNGAKIEDIRKIARGLTSNICDYTFVFVGNIDIATFKPLVEQYIASIPGNASMAIRSIPEFHPELFVTPGRFDDRAKTKMETPQTWVAIIESAEMPFTSKNSKMASIVGQILTNRLLKTVREEWGSVYSISASGSLKRQGLANFNLVSSFPMKCEDLDKVLTFISSEIKGMETNITEDELNPIKEFMVKNAIEARELNGAWLGAMVGNITNNVDTFNDAENEIKSITLDDVKNFMKQVNSQNNYHVVVLEPEN